MQGWGFVVRRSITVVVALAASLSFAMAAYAAGLGRLTVLSPLGQPLLAEIEIVSLQPGEDDSLSARLGSPEAFEQAGIDINPVLNNVRISLERRDKRPFLRVSTTQPVNEPFLDLLIELQWSSGRLVREYTFLLDPPEYRSRQQAIAQTPLPPMQEKPAAAPEEKPAAEAPAATPAAPAAEATPTPAPAPAAEAPKPAAEAPAKPTANTYEVKRGDTLGAIAKQHLRPGVTLNQMLIAIFRANEEAFIRGNVNLVRTGKILQIPEPDAIGTVDRDEANRLMKEQYAQFREYRSRLAAVPSTAEASAGQREVAGRIEQKPEAPKPPASSDQLRLSKAEPGQPAAPGARAAREDDAVARQRALQEAESRIAELEKNLADQQKLLALRNQQLAEVQRQAAAKPAPVPPVAQAPAPAQPAAPKAPEKPAAEAPKPAAPAPEAPKPEAQTPKPAAEAPRAAAEAPKPAAEAPKPATEAPKPAAEAPKPPAAPAKPVAKKAPPPPEPSIIDEFTENPLYIGLLGALLVLLVFYGWWTWRRKKRAHAKFQDSVLGAAAAGGAAGASLAEPTAPPASTTTTTVSQQAVSTAPAGMETEEVDPIAEADVYMAYGRDAQAEEILKEALQKDSNRSAVHAKLLEIYAHRKDTKSFEQTALKLKNITNGAGPEWDKAAALGRSIDPQNGLYAGASAEAAPAAAAAAAPAAAPTLDFDLGGASQAPAATPDISLDEPKESTASGLDFDLGATQTQKIPAAADETVIAGGADKSASGGLDFNLDLGAEEKKPAAPKPAAPASAPAAEESGLDFDLNLDMDKQPESSKPAAEPAKVDLSAISLDLGTGDATVMAPKPSTDPKWQEVATKLDLAKAYEEMGDKDGARELLKEVVKDGDAAQRGSAEQLLAKLG